MRLLLAYASEHGSTAEIASTIGQTLRERGLDVIMERAEQVGDVSNYDVVIIGSAIYLDEWLAPAVEILRRNVNSLATKPLWLFASGPTGEGKAAELMGGVVIPRSVQPVIDQIAPRDVQIFGGKIDLRRLTKIERQVFDERDLAKGDFRNWVHITAWAYAIADTLLDE